MRLISTNLRIACEAIETIRNQMTAEGFDEEYLSVKNCETALKQSAALVAYSRNLQDAWREKIAAAQPQTVILKKKKR